ncbi:MAG: HAD family hydrolase [Lachnospiraceae bacterium]
MRRRIYDGLVNRHAGISYRYHKVHNGTVSIKKVFSWFYLLWLNFCYYVLFCRFLGDIPEGVMYEEKKLKAPGCEGRIYSVDEWTERLKKFDVISFDIFDTLILRPFSEPTDIFFYVGNELGVMDFNRIRAEFEHKARLLENEKSGSYEISLEDIYSLMEKEMGLNKADAMETEKNAELKFCYANPFMKQVYDVLRQSGKRIVVTSDMYLDGEFLVKLLNSCGYTGFEKLFVSCEYKKNKYEGKLYDVVKEYIKDDRLKVAHVGDNPVSDVKMAQKAGFYSFYYENVNKDAPIYRSYDMSPVIGGAYRGIVNNRLYCGMFPNNPEYEFGYVYGGIFVYGYCNFINRYCSSNDIDKILFLSRDGDILKQAYDIIYGGEDTEYVYWSRKAATKLMADYNRYDYFRRFLEHKVNSGVTVGQALKSMELEDMAGDLPVSEKLNEMNVKIVRKYLQDNWEKVLVHYEPEHKGAYEYYKNVLGNSRKVAAVDIGWAGSGAYSLDYLSQKVWQLGCRVVGIVAGTNTVHNAEPQACETFLRTGRIVSYMYSQEHNRDLLKKHNPNKDYNVFWEILLSSPTKQFTGFGYDGSGAVLNFGSYDDNIEGIKQIQHGILDFVRDYKTNFGGITLYGNISGRDAYAPMLVAASNKEKYLKKVERLFNLNVNI